MKENIRFLMKMLGIPVIIGAVFVCNYCYIAAPIINSDFEAREYSNYEFTAIDTQEYQLPPNKNIININTADFDTLCLLHGVGEVSAGNIIEYREHNGDFAKPSEIRAVKGFGDKKFLKIRDNITTGNLK